MNNWRDKLFVTLQYLIPQHGLSRLVGMLDASVVRRVCGSILGETTYAPPRIRTAQFPSAEMIRELAAIAPP